MVNEELILHALDQQGQHEKEGAAAGLAGKTSADCPYGEDTLARTFWLYGFEQASSELALLKIMKFVWSSTEDPPSQFDLSGVRSIPIREAIEGGFWKPRYVTLAMLDEIEKANPANPASEVAA